MIIDGTNLILGRLASFAAKTALEGEFVIIVNSEKIVLTGIKKTLLKRFIEKQHMGHAYKGPFYPKMPDRIVKRTIRGMLPYKQERGMKAFKRIKCFMGLPESYKNQKLETIKGADYSKLKTLNFITVNDLAKSVGKGVA
ncbi:50S ribosomal protein L13 [Candidatus Woesearchaeota archaeon]|nr:50S ribosomal protein L13 [Candidatus Woesearchaeota archaeon]